jgi:hypothetical protein
VQKGDSNSRRIENIDVNGVVMGVVWWNKGIFKYTSKRRTLNCVPIILTGETLVRCKKSNLWYINPRSRGSSKCSTGLKNSSRSKCKRVDAVAVVVSSPSRQRGVIRITWDSIQCVIRVCLFVCQDWDWVSRDWMSQSQVAADPQVGGRASCSF